MRHVYNLPGHNAMQYAIQARSGLPLTFPLCTFPFNAVPFPHPSVCFIHSFPLLHLYCALLSYPCNTISSLLMSSFPSRCSQVDAHKPNTAPPNKPASSRANNSFPPLAPIMERVGAPFTALVVAGELEAVVCGPVVEVADWVGFV